MRLRRGLGALLLVLAAVASAEARPWAWLGVRIRDLTQHEVDEVTARHGLREGFGVVIAEVIADTPAARAGLQPGDIVVAFGLRPVTETRLLQRLIAAAPVGEAARLTVLRTDGRHPVEVRLAAMPRNVVGDRVAAEFGFGIRDGETPGSARPTVAAVLRGSPAERAGLAVGDLLLEVATHPVLTRDAAREELADAELDQQLRLTVQRDERRLSLTLGAPDSVSTPR